MGRKVLLTAICWLTFSAALAEPNTVNSSVAKDNESAESAPRLYQNVPVYASAVPYGAFSFQVPTYVRSPQAASSHLTPVKAGSVIIPSDEFLKNLKDSYGKHVAASAPAATYRAAFPQQFVPLQELPPHLAQPLVSASPGYQFKTAPNYFFGPQSYKVSGLHLTQPMVYAEDLKNFAPFSNYESAGNKFHAATTDTKFPTASQSNEHRVQLSPLKYHEDKKKSYQEKPAKQVAVLNPKKKDTKHEASNAELEQVLASPVIKTVVSAIVNGKKTAVTVDTKPTLPLLDLNLLEPLKFDNPLVPQIQNYLPKISSATYHKLPSFNVNDARKHQKNVIVTKTKSYDSGYSKPKPQNAVPKKKPFTPKQKVSPKPTVTVNGNPNGDEFSYEINTPNHKEVYNEQVVKYNKETNMKPVDYSYNEQSHKEPEVFTYVHSSKSPLKVTHVEYNSDEDGPKHVVYNVSPEEQREEKEDIRQNSSEESDDSGESSAESSAESDEEEAPQQSHYEQAPKEQHHHSSETHEPPKYPQHNENNHYEAPKNSHHPQHAVSYEVPASPRPFQHSYEHHHHNEAPKNPPQQYYIVQQQHSSPPKSTPQTINFRSHEGAPKPFQHLTFKVQSSGAPTAAQHHNNHQSFQVHHETPSHQLKPEHRSQEHQHRPNQEVHHDAIQTTPRYFSQPITVVQNSFQPITPEYHQDIRVLPTHKPHAPIKVEPSQQPHNRPVITHYNIRPSAAPHKKQNPQQEHPATLIYTPHSSPSPHVYEKSKRIIIKEKEETPDEMHTHTEQMSTEMVDREENGEEDFEKAYKESAYGFPAYEETSEDIEKDIFNPESYGVPKFHNDYNFKNFPFEQYQAEGDQFPKSARLSYKDTRDDKKEDYFLDFGVHKPESYTDRINSKVNYYKMFKKNRPEKVYLQFVDNDNKKEKKNEKFTLAPSFDFFDTSPKPKAKQNNYFAQYKAAPIKYEYDYSKEAPRDSSAYASRPYHKYRTHFVEPQFQYGFEPLASQIAIDSELAASASNNSPESEKPGTRKKIYKENWYIKKTTTSGKKPS